jgi:hypothetical protein
MRFGENLAINNMGRSNGAIRLWLDLKLGRYWYVFIWRKGSRPYCYRSLDATPPCEDNAGRWIIGRRYGRAD